MTKESTYTPISQRENILDEDIAKIVDYLERHSKSFAFEDIIYFDNFICIFHKGDAIIKLIKGDLIITIPTRILSENIVGIYGSLKNYKS